MFQNNNGAVIKYLAGSSLHASKRRNFMTIVTIALAVAMMMSIALFMAEAKQKQKNDDKLSAQAVFTNIPEGTIGKIKSDSDVHWVGEQFTISLKKEKNYILSAAYYDNTAIKANKIKLQGKMPQKMDEILVEQSFLYKTGSNAKIGDTIRLDIGNGGSRDYRITGLINQNTVKKGNYIVIVSRPYVENLNGGREISCNACIRLKDSDSLSESELDDKVNTLAGKYSIPPKNVSVIISQYQLIASSSKSNITAYIAIAAIIMIAAAVVIYSIFYISVAGKIREYGQLRTLGTTNRQIRRIVFREGRILSAIGIPAGLILGGIVGFLSLPQGWNAVTAIILAVIIGITGLLLVMFSIWKPAKIAADTSPMEALRYSSYTSQIKKKKSRKLYRKITPLSLAGMNFLRSRKKALLTMLSLGFSGILLVCAASMFGSYDPAAAVKRDFAYGEYIIQIQRDSGNTFAVGRAQMHNPLNEALKNKILSIDGVKGIKTWPYIVIGGLLPNGTDDQFPIDGFSRDEIGMMRKYLTAGTLNYDTLVSNNGVVICQPKLVKEASGWKVKIGDKIKATVLNSRGKEVQMELPVMAIMSDNYRESGITFWMTADSLHNMTGMDCTYEIEIAADNQKENAVGRQLKKIVDPSTNLNLQSKQEYMRVYSGQIHGKYLAACVLITFLALFGIINLINTMITNLISRKQEIGILQAVGMSSRQLSQMLQAEGLLYTVGTAVLTLTAGTALGYAACIITKKMGMAIQYRFPLNTICIFIAVLLIIQLLISAFTVKYLKKQSLIERIQDME